MSVTITGPNSVTWDSESAVELIPNQEGTARIIVTGVYLNSESSADVTLRSGGTDGDPVVVLGEFTDGQSVVLPDTQQGWGTCYSGNNLYLDGSGATSGIVLFKILP